MGDFTHSWNFVTSRPRIKGKVSLHTKGFLVVMKGAMGDIDYKVQCIILIVSYCAVLYWHCMELYYTDNYCVVLVLTLLYCNVLILAVLYCNSQILTVKLYILLYYVVLWWQCIEHYCTDTPYFTDSYFIVL